MGGGRSFGRTFRPDRQLIISTARRIRCPASSASRPAAAGPAAASYRSPFRVAVAIDALPWENFDSPKRKFRGYSKKSQSRLGAKPSPTHRASAAHPFELETWARLAAPGFSGCPYHSPLPLANGSSNIFLEGTGTVRTAKGPLHPVGPGDAVLHPPGEAAPIHQYRYAFTSMQYFLVADNPAIDILALPPIQTNGATMPREKIFGPLTPIIGTGRSENPGRKLSPCR